MAQMDGWGRNEYRLYLEMVEQRRDRQRLLGIGGFAP